MRSPSEIQDDEKPSVNITNVSVAAGPSRLRTWLKIGVAIFIVLVCLFSYRCLGTSDDLDPVANKVKTRKALPDDIKLVYFVTSGYGITKNDVFVEYGPGDAFDGWRVQSYGKGWVDFTKDGVTKRYQVVRRDPASVWADPISNTDEGASSRKRGKGIFSRSKLPRGSVGSTNN